MDLILGEEVPAGVYHLVVKIVTITKNGQVLLTRRSQEKKNALAWEFTGGCVKKGETHRCAAARELKEKTGISVEEGQLELLKRLTVSRERGSYHLYIYAAVIPAACEITLLEGETVDSRWVSTEQFRHIIKTDPRVIPNVEREAFIIAFDEFLKAKNFYGVGECMHEYHPSENYSG